MVLLVLVVGDAGGRWIGRVQLEGPTARLARRAACENLQS